jgi:hypothetical protein
VDELLVVPLADFGLLIESRVHVIIPAHPVDILKELVLELTFLGFGQLLTLG